MKVGINITRDALGGITTTNLSLLDQLHGSTHNGFVGVELNPARKFKAAALYRHLDPDWFSHHVISVCDMGLGTMMEKSKDLKSLEKNFEPIIKLIQEILRKEEVDIMLINGTYYVPWLISLACKREKIPIVLWYAGVLSRETSHFKPKARKLMQELEKSVVRMAKSIIFPSELCKRVVINEVLNSERTRGGVVLPNPINPVFTQCNSSELSVDNRIGFVGRFNKIKNPEGFIKIHKALLKAGWPHEATMVTNASPKERRSIPKTIQVLPSMSPEELQIFYSTQGIILSPSEFETFGNVPIEAVCTGIPVLVHENLGCTDVLKESNLSDFVVDFNNMDEVLTRVKKFCGQQIFPKQINNVRKRVEAKYLAQEIVAVLKLALER